MLTQNFPEERPRKLRRVFAEQPTHYFPLNTRRSKIVFEYLNDDPEHMKHYSEKEKNAWIDAGYEVVTITKSLLYDKDKYHEKLVEAVLLDGRKDPRKSSKHNEYFGQIYELMFE